MDRPARLSARGLTSTLVFVATLVMIRRRQLLKSEKVARIQFNGTLQVVRRLLPITLAAGDVARVFEYSGVVGQCSPGDSQLSAGASVIAEAVVVVVGQRKVGFARIRLETQRDLHGRLSQFETSRGAVVALNVDIAMHPGEQAPGEQELRIVSDRFVEQRAA